MPKLPPRLCSKHARGEREDEISGPELRPPQGSSACSLCKREKAEAEQAALRRMTSGTRTLDHDVTADDPDVGYQPQSARARQAVDWIMEAQREEAQRVAPAVAKADAERPTLIALDHAKPGPERQRAYDRHMRVLNGRGHRRRMLDDGVEVVVDHGADFDRAMQRAEDFRERIRAQLESNEVD